MAAYALHLLGAPRLEVNGTEIHVSRRKAMALLAYLAVTGRPHTRDALATLLWPEWDASAARGALRRHLSLVNQLLGGDGLDTNRETVQLSPGLDLWLDVVDFRRRLTGCESHNHGPTRACATCLPHLENAIALYRDHFMAGFTLEAGASFDDWQVFCAESLKEEMAGALVGVATYVASLGDLERAVAHTRRWLALDPVSEPAHRHLMVLYAKSDRRTAALRQYETCCHVLEVELGAEPSKRTQEIYLQLLRDELPAAPATAEAILERELRTVGPCPYRGLAPFREVDASLFFGRESYIERLHAAITGLPFITAVVGPSGSGKSSVVAAGLLPRLREAGGWLVTTFRPGSQPFRALANALIPALEPDLSETAQLIERRHLAEALAGGEVALIDVIARIRDKVDGRPSALLVIDQFEELYTLCPDAQMRQSFIDTVLAAVQTTPPARYERVPLVLLFTLRADFMGQALTHRHLADALQMAAQMLGPMTREELRSAIVRPAEAQGAAFESGLVERLLDDVAGEPGNLPLLEFALTLLWERLDFGWLTHAAYEKIGRAEGALARYAQEEFEALTSEDQKLARRIFVQLVQPGEGTEDTRRVAARSDLANPAGLGDEAWDLVRHLADRRLVVTDHDPDTGVETVEVVHEALIQHWQQLEAWMAEDRAFRTWQERLRVGLRTWEATDRDEGALLRGVPLAEAEEWLRTRDLSRVDRRFIQAGVALREQRSAERAAQRQRETESAQQLAAAHSQAVREREEALRQAAIGLASEAELQRQGPRPERAVLLALEALEHYPYTWQAERALGQAVLSHRLVLDLHHGQEVNSASLSPNGTRILTAGEGGVFRVWDAATGAELLNVVAYEGRGADLCSAQWSPSGDRVLTMSAEGVPKVWDAGTGELRLSLQGHSAWGADWSPDGTRILTSYSTTEDTVRVWDADTGQELTTLPGDKGRIVRAFWSPDGRLIATTIGQVWDAETAKLYLTFEPYRDDYTYQLQGQARFSPDGRYVVVSGIDGTAGVWELSSRKETWALRGAPSGRLRFYWAPHGDRLLTIAEDGSAKVWDTASQQELFGLVFGAKPYARSEVWSPDGTRLIAPGEDGSVQIWDAVVGTKLQSFKAHEGQAYVVGWLGDRDAFITGGSDGHAKVWNTSTVLLSVGCEPDCPFSPVGGLATNPAWSPSGAQVARGYMENTARVWDVATGQEVLQIQMPTVGDIWRDWLWRVNWSPTGDQLLTTAGNGTAMVWDAATGAPRLTLAAHENVPTGAWSPDGARIVTSAEDGYAKVWDATSGELLTTFSELTTPYAAAWSPDGTLIASCDWSDSTVVIWDAETGEPVLALSSADSAEGVSAIGWSPDGGRLAAFSDDGIARIWDTATGEQRLAFSAIATAQSAKWSVNGDRILAASMSGIAGVWDAATGNELVWIEVGSFAFADWSPDGDAIAIADFDGNLTVYPAWQSLEELVAYAKEHCVLRELTPEERAKFGLPER